MKAPPLDSSAFNIAIFALLLSLPWEFGQMWLYAGSAGMSHLQGIRVCMAATAGDAVIMLIAFGIVAIAARSLARVHAPTTRQVSGFVAIGLVITIGVELVATRSDGLFSWRYAPAMPVAVWVLARMRSTRQAEGAFRGGSLTTMRQSHAWVVPSRARRPYLT